MLRRSHETFGE